MKKILKKDIPSAVELNYYNYYFSIKSLNKVNKTIKGNFNININKSTRLQLLHKFVKYFSTY